jgi:starch phosphorylase
MRVTVELAGLAPDDVRVEAVVGQVAPDGHLEENEVITLKATEQKGTACVYEYSYMPRHTGHVGYALRVSPNHITDPLTRPCGDLLRWA